MVKGQAGQKIGAQMVNATTGAAFSGTVTVYLTGDAGTQAIGTVAAGVCTAEGNGYYTYAPSQAETDYDLIAFTFIGTGAIPATIQVTTFTAAQAAAVNVATPPGAVTYRDLISNALKRIGVLGGGQTAASEDVADGLQRLNALLDLWAAERLFVPSITRTTWTIVSGTAAYTVGTGGAVSVTRPVFVTDINFVDTAMTPDLELDLTVLTDQAYADLPMKALTNTYPTAAYYNPTFTGTGLASVTLYPVPTSTTLLGVLYAPAQLAQVGSLSTTVLLQPGYQWMLQENLAVMLAPEFGQSVSDDLRRSAMEAKATIKRANLRLVDQPTVAGALFGGRGMPYNIYSGM
jgi:hypothetical protein